MQKQDAIKKVLSEINSLFGKVFVYNNRLLNLCNNKNYSPTYIEVFDFYITSQAISFLKNFFFQHIESPGIFLNARCIIEGLALKGAFKNGYYNDSNLDLLKKQIALIEYKQYKKFQECHATDIIPENIKDQYDVAFEYFKKALPSVSISDLKRIVNSPAPFACDPKFSFQKVIKDTIGNEWSMRYSFLSALIHPNANEPLIENVHTYLLLDTLVILKNEYSYLPDGVDLKTLSRAIFSGRDPERFLNSIKSECSELENVIAVFNKKYGNNYVSNTFNIISTTIQEMAFDTVYGFTEQAKSKWKVLIELLSVFYETCLLSSDTENSCKLIQYYDEIVIMRALKSKENGSEELLKEAYKIYKLKYPNGISEEKFTHKFETPTGYTIDDNGKTKTLTELVGQLAKVFEKEGEGISNGHSIMFHYKEAQMISHANGYLWFANTGAWSDINGLFYLFNQIMCFLCATMGEIFKNCYKESNSYIDKKISITLARAAKQIGANTKDMYELLLKRDAILPS